MGDTWICSKCNAKAVRGMAFGFHPFKNFPGSPDCPHCFAKRSMLPFKQPTGNGVIRLRLRSDGAPASKFKITFKAKSRR